MSSLPTNHHTQSPFRIEVEYLTPAPGPWLEVDPFNGTFATDASLSLTMTAAPEGAPPGAHLARVLLVRTSWPWEVPVEETVASVDVQLTVAGPITVRCVYAISMPSLHTQVCCVHLCPPSDHLGCRQRGWC